MSAPWWFCCGWWSPWCVLDTIAHRLHVTRWTRRVCDRHDAVIVAAFDETLEEGEAVEVFVSPSLRITSEPRTWSNGTGTTWTWR